MRRLATFIFTVLAAASLAHVLFAHAVDDVPLRTAIAGVPAYLSATFIHGDLGTTPGGGCDPKDPIMLCASWGAAPMDEMLRERLPVDLQLVLGGMLLGTALGLLAGRHAAAHPRTLATRGVHGATAFLLSCPPYFLAFAVLVFFSWSSGRYAVPFVSGQADYVPLHQDPLGFLKAIWAPWVLVALPLAAFVARMTEASLREALDGEFIRTAYAKGLPPRRVLDRHALPVAAPPIAALTGVNVSTMLINAAAVEYGFSLPGMFTTIRGAILGSDVVVLQALVLEGVVPVTLANFAADAFQSWLDPRL